MTDTNRSAELDRLRADVATLIARDQTRETELAALRRALRPRRRRHLAPTLLLALFVAFVPLSLLAANPFNDLVPGSVHNGDIDAIYNVGVTTGCDPNVSYCPTANVTRQEMASFLARLGGLGGHPPVANAATLQGYAPSGLVRVAQALGTNTTGNDFTGITATPNYAELPGAVVTINAPSSGYVLINSSVSISSPATTTVIARVRDVTPGAPASAVSPEVSRFDAGDFGTGVLNVTYLFPVSGAGAKTFRIEMARTAGAPAARNGVITALFVPFDQNGATLP